MEEQVNVKTARGGLEDILALGRSNPEHTAMGQNPSLRLGKLRLITVKGGSRLLLQPTRRRAPPPLTHPLQVCLRPSLDLPHPTRLLMGRHPLSLDPHHLITPRAPTMQDTHLPTLHRTLPLPLLSQGQRRHSQERVHPSLVVPTLDMEGMTRIRVAMHLRLDLHLAGHHFLVLDTTMDTEDMAVTGLRLDPRLVDLVSPELTPTNLPHTSLVARHTKVKVVVDGKF